MKTLKYAICLVLALSGCAGQQWTSDVADAVDPVAQKGLPFAGEALQALSVDFYVFCPVEKPRSPECLKVRDTLNKMIAEYNKVNDVVLEAY